MMKAIILSFLFLLSACVSKQEFTVLSNDYKNKEKILIELSEGSYTPDLRIALSKRGYKLLKFPSQRKIIHSLTDKETEVFNQAASNYALETHFTSYYKCNFSDARMVKINAEVVNIKTNEVIAVISVKGWTDDCPLTTNEQVFEKLIDYLDELEEISK